MSCCLLQRFCLLLCKSPTFMFSIIFLSASWWSYKVALFDDFANLHCHHHQDHHDDKQWNHDDGGIMIFTLQGGVGGCSQTRGAFDWWGDPWKCQCPTSGVNIINKIINKITIIKIVIIKNHHHQEALTWSSGRVWRFNLETSRFPIFFFYFLYSFGFGSEQIWYQKKYRIQYGRNFVSEKVSVSFGFGCCHTLSSGDWR